MWNGMKDLLPSKRDFIVSLVLFFGFAIVAGIGFEIVRGLL